jgi:hypothetical protein
MWPAEVPSGLDVRNLWDKQHLLEDIRIAEELDIRHRDSVLGRKVTSVFGIVVRMGGQRPPSVSPIAHSNVPVYCLIVLQTLTAYPFRMF